MACRATIATVTAKRIWIAGAIVLALLPGCTSERWLADARDPDDTYPPPCEREGIKACETACDSSDAAACLALAQAHRVGHQHLVKSTSAMARFEAMACGLGYGRTCLYSANNYRREGGDRELKLSEKSCRLEYGPGCFRAGTLHGRAEDYDDAVGYFERGCELKHGNSCFGVGELQRVGLGLPRDEVKAARMRRRACELGAESACGWPEKGSPLLRIAQRRTPNPPVAALRGLEPPGANGRALVETHLCVTLDGEVSSVSTTKSSGNKALDRVVREHVLGWEFVAVSDSEEGLLGCTLLRLRVEYEAGAPRRGVFDLSDITEHI